MPGIEDWVNNPLDIIQNIFDQQSEVDNKVVKEYFSARTQNKNAMSWIPSLNDGGLHTLKPNSLVRYRCMIQDMFDPEFYLGVYEVKDNKMGRTVLKSGKYKDVAECSKDQEINLESPRNKTMDRQTLYCVPVPGETTWVKEGYADRAGIKTHPSTSRTPVRSKRGLEEEGESCQDNSEAMETNEESSDKNVPIDSDKDSTMETSETKRTKKDENIENSSAALPDLNFPLQNEVGIACLVKIYEDLDEFKLNDVVEFIGVLSVDPSLAQFDGDNESENGPQSSVEDLEISVEERSAHAPPPSLVPRLHAILARRLLHTNPLLTALTSQEDDFKMVFEELQSEIGRLRQDIISALEHVVFGDGLAVEYLLCHLISSVYGRADVMPLGKFCLNLSKIPSSNGYGQLLHTFLSSIVTKSHLLPVTLDNMNKMKLSPQKDYKANRLISGVLQLSDNTSLVVDETVLAQGQLDVNGVKNMTALGNLISWQKVQYDFCYHQQDFLANVAVLVLSEAKSCFPSDCFLPLCANPPPGQSMYDYFSKLDSVLNDGLLNKIRLYLTVCKMLDYNMAEEIQKTIEDDFVEVRKEDSKKMTIDDFHSLLNLVRLLSLSYMQTSPTPSLWNKAKTMEMQRKLRIQDTNSTSRIMT